MAKKILVHFSPLAAIGGCEVNCLRVLEGLPDHEHHVVVFDDRGPMSDQWEAAGAKVEHLQAWRKGTGVFQTALREWAQGRDTPFGIFYWSTSRLPVVLNILQFWDAPWVVHLGNPVPGNFTARLRRLHQEYSFDAFSNITLIACSGRVAESHRTALYFRKFRTETIYNPVTPTFDRPRVHRALPLGCAPKVGMVARLDSIKDHLTLIRALAASKQIRSDVILEFAGAGHLRESLFKEAVRLRVAERIRFFGAVTDVPGLIAGWDVYLHSTTAAEGMGTAVAEAMMAGLPCVVSDLPVMREICGNEGAIYASPADPVAWGRAVMELVGNRERRAVLGGVAQRRARNLFTLAEVAARYLGALRPASIKETP